jgi:hypothetical protein
MRALALLGVSLLFVACEKIDYIELEPSNIVFKQPNNQQWVSAKAMARNGVRAVKARVIWSVADPTVARVDAKGLVTPVGDGETEVIAKIDDVEARVPVQVIYVDRVEVEPTELTLVEGSPAAAVKVRAFRKNGKELTDRTPLLTCEDKKVAQIVGSGEILALDPGTATVVVQVEQARTSLKVTVEKDKNAPKK